MTSFSKSLIFKCLSTIIVFAATFSCLPTPVFASTENFYFDSFVGDYFLTKDASEGSRLHVKETFTAVFPDSNQNHGIRRNIPYTNQAGHNLTIASESALNLKVTRNGQLEPFSIVKQDGYYEVRIGNTNTYVHGTQHYTLEYDFTRVITEHEINVKDNSIVPIQELYWDTNGTGWPQQFGSLTANVHYSTDIQSTNYPGTNSTTSCYVGTNGQKGENRCTTTKLSDGYSFSTTNLSRGENLSFDISFAANTFSIPQKPDSYILTIIFVIEIIIILIVGLIIYFKLWQKVRDRYRWYKSSPTPPQYSPLKDYTVAQHAAVYIKTTKDPKVATLLELAISKKISLIKGEKRKIGKKHRWSVKINDLNSLSEEQLSLLKLFNNGHIPTVGTIYKVKKQTYSYVLEVAYNNYSSAPLAHLKAVGDFIDQSSSKSTKALKTIILIIILSTFVIPTLTTIAAESLTEDFNLDYYNVIAPLLIYPIVILPIATIISCAYIRNKLRPFLKYTQQGLEHSNYVEGLKLYIGMAEADRLKFLQSVNGADVSNEGIIKLYEKLLPYAALFGQEQSWLNEMEHYYDASELVQPDWYDVGLAYALSSHTFSDSLSRPVDPSSYSSSGSSGGGGGGSSGGGGGGGGGGGW